MASDCVFENSQQISATMPCRHLTSLGQSPGGTNACIVLLMRDIFFFWVAYCQVRTLLNRISQHRIQLHVMHGSNCKAEHLDRWLIDHLKSFVFSMSGSDEEDLDHAYLDVLLILWVPNEKFEIAACGVWPFILAPPADQWLLSNVSWSTFPCTLLPRYYKHIKCHSICYSDHNVCNNILSCLIPSCWSASVSVSIQHRQNTAVVKLTSRKRWKN